MSPPSRRSSPRLKQTPVSVSTWFSERNKEASNQNKQALVLFDKRNVCSPTRSTTTTTTTTWMREDLDSLIGIAFLDQDTCRTMEFFRREWRRIGRGNTQVLYRELFELGRLVFNEEEEDDDNEVEMYNTATSNLMVGLMQREVILAENLLKVGKTRKLGLDTMLAVTHVAFESEHWLYDNDIPEDTAQVTQRMGQVWKRIVDLFDEESNPFGLDPRTQTTLLEFLQQVQTTWAQYEYPFPFNEEEVGSRKRKKSSSSLKKKKRARS